jgi:hypothetical protein
MTVSKKDDLKSAIDSGGSEITVTGMWAQVVHFIIGKHREQNEKASAKTVMGFCMAPGISVGEIAMVIRIVLGAVGAVAVLVAVCNNYDEIEWSGNPPMIKLRKNRNIRGHLYEEN